MDTQTHITKEMNNQMLEIQSCHLVHFKVTLLKQF
jgi:hypothetical protein